MAEPRSDRRFSRFAVVVFSLSLPASCVVMLYAGPGNEYGLLLSIAMFVFGVLAMKRVEKRKEHLAGGLFGAVAMLLGVFTALLAPGYSYATPRDVQSACQGNLWNLESALNMYMNDFDGFLPGPDWCDALVEGRYLRDKWGFRCDEVSELRCGYALNGNLAGQRNFAGETVMLFESDLGWNGVGGPRQMVSPPRHPDGVSVYYGDGTQAVVPEDELDQLRWE